jgi:hypothetical protein
MLSNVAYNYMKALAVFCLTICILYALVADAEGKTIAKANSTAEQMQQEVKWTGHINYIFGYKILSNDWKPAEDQIEFGLVDLDLRRSNWQVSIVGQLLMTYSSDIPERYGFEGDFSSTYEFNLGLRKVWENSSCFHPFLGGGPSIIGGSTTRQIDRPFGGAIYVQDDNDTGYGYWVGGGFYWVLTERLHTGLNAQYTSGKIKLFENDLNAGGIHLNVIIGYHW